MLCHFERLKIYMKTNHNDNNNNNNNGHLHGNLSNIRRNHYFNLTSNDSNRFNDFATTIPYDDQCNLYRLDEIG